MAVRYVVEDSSWRGEVNVPRKEFGFNRLRYLWAVSYTHLTLPTIQSV